MDYRVNQCVFTTSRPHPRAELLSGIHATRRRQHDGHDVVVQLFCDDNCRLVVFVFHADVVQVGVATTAAKLEDKGFNESCILINELLDIDFPQVAPQHPIVCGLGTFSVV